jgi:nucleoside phosphorylase/tetratricopeptide (TPR) repeat protein
MNADAVDVLVITALPEELKALLAVTAGVREPWAAHDGDLPLHTAVLDGRAGPLRVAVTRLTKMGGIEAAAEAAPLIAVLNPGCLAMCGVCAGQPEDTDLGDVVIGDRLFQHDEGKIRQSGFQGDMWAYVLRDYWLRVAQNQAGPADGLHGYAAAAGDTWKWWILERLLTGPDPLRSAAFQRYLPDALRAKRLQSLFDEDLAVGKGSILELTPLGRDAVERHLLLHGVDAHQLPYHVHVGPIGSGNSVEASGEVWERLATGGMRKTLAVEMEAAAIGRLAHKHQIPFAVAKGVMDRGDPHKAQRFKGFAARASAEVLCKFLRAVVEPRGRASQVEVPDDRSPPGRVKTEDRSAEAAGVDSSAQRRQIPYDLFLSYRTHHAARVEPLIAALEAEGVRVWRDLDRIRSGDSITAELRAGLAASRALVVFATEDYADSRTCAWELASAWIAAERGGQTVQRILLLNPEDGELRGDLGQIFDHRAFAVRASEPAAAAREIAGHLETCGASTFGELVELGSSPRWFPYHRSGSSRFVGRLGDLWDLHSRLVGSRPVAVTGDVGPSIVQVRGLGGIGKTLFVLEYARRFEVAWPGGIVWFDADDDWSADAEPSELLERRCRLLAGLAGALGVKQILGDLAATAHAVETALLARTNGRAYLWILDNVPPGTTQRAIDALMPPDSGGALILTTRWRALNSLGNHLDLGVLRSEEALALLTADRPPRGEDELAAASEVVEAVGRHAYALDVLRALVRDAATTATPYRTWARRLADIQDDTLDEAAKELAEELPTGKAKAISAVFADSLDGRSEAALDVLRLAAVLADASCPGEFVTAVLERCGHGGGAVERAVGELAAHALVTHDLEVPGIHVHSLVRRVAVRWRCDQARLDVLAAQAQEILNQRFRDIDPLDLRQHPSLLPLLPHAHELADASTILAARLSVNIGNFIMARGSSALARTRFEAARATFEREEGVDSSHYLGTLTNLAGCIQEQGDLVGACAIYETVFTTRLKILGAEDRSTLEAQQNLAVAVEARGDYPRARELLEGALSSAIRQFGSVDKIALIIELNLANVDQAQGKLAEGLERMRRVFDGLSQVHGPEHPKTMRILANMAGLLATMGDLSTARKYFEQILKIDERDKGPEHPDSLQDRQNLAGLLYQAGDWARSRAIEEEVLAARERVLGPEHPNTLDTRQSLAVTCERLGDLAAAILHRDRAQEGLQRNLGPQHPRVMIYLHNRAILARSLGDLDQARQIEEAVFAGLRLRLGADHPWTLTSKHHLAELMRENGELKAACAMYSEVLSARQRLLGNRHPDTLNTQRGLAGALVDLGEIAGAREVFETVLPIMEEILPNHPDTIVTRYNLVFVLNRIDPALAEPYMPKLRALRERKFDELSSLERDIVKKLARLEHSKVEIEFHPSPVAPEARGRRRRPGREKN